MELILTASYIRCFVLFQGGGVVHGQVIVLWSECDSMFCLEAE